MSNTWGKWMMPIWSRKDGSDSGRQSSGMTHSAERAFQLLRGWLFATESGERYGGLRRASSVERWQESEGPYSEAAEALGITNWQNAQIHEALEEGLSELSEREHLVLSLHYGWDGRPPQTFAEIGETLGLTRQRMHQIHNEALLLLRVPALSIRLRSIYERGSRSDYRQALRQNQEWQHKYRRRG